MNVIKVTLGFLELAFALKFLSVADLAYGWRILDRETFLALWIVIVALLGFYLLGKIKFPHDDDDTKVSVSRFFMALVSLAFAVYMVPGLWGAPLKAVSAFAPPMKTQDFNLYTNEVHAKFDDYDLGMEYARQHNKPVMLDFTGDVYKRQIYCGEEVITHQVIVQRTNGKTKPLKDVTELVGKNIYVKPGKYYERLVNLNKELGGGILIHQVTNDSITAEDLITQVAQGKIPYTVADNDVAKLNATYYPNLNTCLLYTSINLLLAKDFSAISRRVR